jgi:VWFA-related protein
MRATRRRTFTMTAVWWAAMAAAASLQQPPPPASAQRPTFRSGVELITVDATVVDAAGQPIVGLVADDFEVLVDGKPRRVVSAQFVDLSGSTPQPAAAPALSARPLFSSNETGAANAVPPPDRFILLAVDHSSFMPGSGRATLEAARRFLSQLDASDRVALVSYPEPGVFIPPTADRAAVARELGRIVGTAERIEPVHREMSIGLSEALDIVAGDRATYDKVVARECGGIGGVDLDQCRAIVELDAPQMVTILRARTARSLVGLRSVLGSLSALGGRKTVILISAGLASAPEHSALDLFGELAGASEAAARANAVIHALHVDSSFSDAYGVERNRPPASVVRDAQMFTAGLETVVNRNGGALFSVPAKADAAFGRITREISAFYILGVEAGANDRDGKAHAIKVRLTGRKATVRHRQQFAIAKPALADVSPEEDLAAVLRSGQILRELPLRVSTQVMRDPRNDLLRVIVRADIGRDVAAPGHLRVGLALFDDAGQPAGSASNLRPYEPTAAPDAAWPYQEILTVRPGAYTLRLAAKDADGRVGSVVHRFDAALEAGQGLRLSDLLLADLDRVRPTQPATLVDGRVRGARLDAFVEVYPDHGTAVSRVSFEIAAPGGPALVTVPGTLTDRVDGQRATARALLDVGALPPGDYVVSATAFDRAAALGRVTSPVEVTKSVAAAGRAASGAGAGGAAASAAAGAWAPRPFERRDVLRSDAVTHFLGRLRAEDPSGATPAVHAAAEAIGRGDYDEALRGLSAANSASLSVRFLGGLALLGKGEIEAAAAQFRASLRLARQFLPAAFYLGACEAASGRDGEAIASWQTALISEGEAKIVYEALADAWLRRQDGQEALAVIARARARWPDDEGFARREAVAKALGR